VRLSKDGEVVVFHDETTKRIGKRDKPVAQQTLAELRELDAGHDERIPTLAEAPATIPAGHTMHVEIKSGPETAPAIAKVIKASGKNVVLQGYPADSLAALARETPSAPAFWDVDPPLDANKKQLPYALTVIADAKQHGFPGLALDVRGVTPELLRAAHDAGILVDVWTLNERELIVQWSTRDVRWIETDRPDLAP